jgi:hypothetical protein
MIILLGFPKSGTSSFQKLFTDLGYKSYHHVVDKRFIGTMIYNNKNTNKPLLNDFLDTDVITQMDVCINKNNAYWPQITDYKQLYNENKNSVFILNKREPIRLLSSFKRWNNLHERLIKYNPELLNNNSDKAFVEFVIKHYTNIESFFSQYPNSKFITFDIENDNLEKLQKYIDLKNIQKLPHENKNNKSTF